MKAIKAHGVKEKSDATTFVVSSRVPRCYKQIADAYSLNISNLFRQFLDEMFNEETCPTCRQKYRGKK